MRSRYRCKANTQTIIPSVNFKALTLRVAWCYLSGAYKLCDLSHTPWTILLLRKDVLFYL